MYLHHQNPPVVHRDLSPNNVLLTEHLIAKLSDLGVAKAIKADNKKMMTKVPGTSDFIPPEALDNSSKYGPSLDIFSYGGVSLYLICEQWPELLPIKRFDPYLRRAVALTELERRQPHSDKMLGDAKNLKPIVLQCLDDDPSMRPFIKDIHNCIALLKQSAIEVKSFPVYMVPEGNKGLCENEKTRENSSVESHHCDYSHSTNPAANECYQCRQFHGNAEWGGLCSMCFKEMLKKQANMKPLGSTQMRSNFQIPNKLNQQPYLAYKRTFGLPKVLCRTPGCSFYAKAELENYCDDCYEKPLPPARYCVKLQDVHFMLKLS